MRGKHLKIGHDRSSVRRDALMEASSLLDTPHGKDIDMKDRPHCAARQHAAHLVFDPLQKRLDVGEVDGLPQGRQLLQHGAWTAIPVEDFPARHRMVPRELRAGHRDCEDRGARTRGRWRSRFFCSGAKVPRASPM